MPKRCLFFILAAAGLTAIQPDLGSTGVILGISVVTLLLAQVRFRDLALLFGTLALGGILVVAFAPGFYDYAHKRLTTWVNPTADNDSTAYQITQSRGALAVAGLWGKGYLKGEQKINRLPLSTKDFVYPVMVEELGLIGGIAILATFLYLGFVGIQLGLSCRDPFNQTAIAALGLAVTLQALVNIGTTLGTLPLSGLTLPFLSGGGTSLILSYFCIGLMAALGRSEATLLRREETRPVRVLNRGQSG
jgi:cell division protein FtsW